MLGSWPGQQHWLQRGKITALTGPCFVPLLTSYEEEPKQPFCVCPCEQAAVPP